jgi:hypothetical protein
MDYIQKTKANNIVISLFGVAVICFSFFYLQLKHAINEDNQIILGGFASIAILFCIVSIIGSLFSKSILKLGAYKNYAMSATSFWILLCLFIKLY